MFKNIFKKLFLFTSLFILILALAACGAKKSPGALTGVLTFVLGKVEVNKGAEYKAVQKGEIITEGSSIRTDKGAVAILEVASEGLKVEIQPEAEFQVKSLGKVMEMQLERGNAWTKISRTKNGRELFFKTATSVAAVRGTKFYTFFRGDIVGTCHCEGQISLGNLLSKKVQTNHEDYVAFHQQGKTIYLTRADHEKAGLPVGHDHSAMDDSPLGKKAQMSPENAAKMAKLIQERFAALK
jgi:hypothetical protein